MSSFITNITLLLSLITFYAVSQNNEGTFKVKKQQINTNTASIKKDSIFFFKIASPSLSTDTCPCGGNIDSRLIKSCDTLSKLLVNCKWFNDSIFITSYETFVVISNSDIQKARSNTDAFNNNIKNILRSAHSGRKVTFTYIRAYNRYTGIPLKLPSVTFNAL